MKKLKNKSDRVVEDSSSYYDGMPRWIMKMSLEEIEEAIKIEEEKLRQINNMMKAKRTKTKRMW